MLFIKITINTMIPSLLAAVNSLRFPEDNVRLPVRISSSNELFCSASDDVSPESKEFARMLIILAQKVSIPDSTYINLEPSFLPYWEEKTVCHQIVDKNTNQPTGEMTVQPVLSPLSERLFVLKVNKLETFSTQTNFDGIESTLFPEKVSLKDARTVLTHCELPILPKTHYESMGFIQPDHTEDGEVVSPIEKIRIFGNDNFHFNKD